MIPRSFPAANLVYTGPSPEVGDLPCQRVAQGVIRSVWELTPDERVAVAEGADIALVIWSEPIPPVALGVCTDPKVIPGLRESREANQ